MVDRNHQRLKQPVKVSVVYGEHGSVYAISAGAVLAIDQRGAYGCAGVAVVADPTTLLLPLTE